jgi:hypothetical protein
MWRGKELAAWVISGSQGSLTEYWTYTNRKARK